MSEVLGPLSFGKKEEAIFLGREIAQHRDFSEHTAQIIDREVRDIVERNYHKAREIVSAHLDVLRDLALALLEFETLNGEEIDQIVAGQKIVRKPVPTPDNTTPTASAPVTAAATDGKPETGGGATPAPLPA